MPKVLEKDELDALLDAPSGRSTTGIRNRVALALMGRLGLRVQEVCDLKVSDVKLNGKAPHVKLIGKGDRERHLPLVNSTRDLLALWIEKRPKGGKALLPVIQNGKRTFGTAKPGRAVSTRSVRQMVKHFGDKALGRHVHPHMLRTTAGTEAYRKTKDIRAVQDMLGHADISTTQIYTHVSGADLVEVMKAVDGGTDGDELAQIRAALTAIQAEGAALTARLDALLRQK